VKSRKGLWALLVLTLLPAWGCPDIGNSLAVPLRCPVNGRRCNGNVVEYCNATSHQWEVHEDCAASGLTCKELIDGTSTFDAICQ
jgi:hypothetical protein